MAYITTAQLNERLGDTIYARLTDRINGTTPNGTVAQQIVDEAEGVTNSYLSRRYATPLDLAAHPELQNILEARVLDVAEFLAWKGSPFVSDIPERVRILYTDTIRWLDAVVAGRIALPAASPPASGTAENEGPRYTSRQRAFTGDELDGL